VFRRTRYQQLRSRVPDARNLQVPSQAAKHGVASCGRRPEVRKSNRQLPRKKLSERLVLFAGLAFLLA